MGKYCNLSEDVEIEVLLRLPVKSILRFKCVCRSWHTLLECPTFVNSHLSRSRSNNNYCLVTRNSDMTLSSNGQSDIAVSLLSADNLEVLTDVQLPEFKRRWLIGVTGSCNGIICLTYMTGHYALFNPATKQFKILPLPPDYYIKVIYNVCSTHVLGFVAKSNDYKILRLSRIGNPSATGGYPHSLEIFSLRTGSWKQMKVSLDYRLPIRLWYNGFINGVYHFVTRASDENLIVTFDLHDEAFGKMRHPPIEGCGISTASVLNGCLAIVDKKYGYGRRFMSMDVWLMKEYGNDESWTKTYTVPFGHSANSELEFWRGNKLLLQMNESDDPYNFFGDLISCDLNTREVKKHQVRGAWDSMRCFEYVPSLVSVVVGNI